MQSWRGGRKKKRKLQGKKNKTSLRKFTLNGLAGALAHFNKLHNTFENMDPNTERFLLTQECSWSTVCKSMIFKKIQVNKQTTMDISAKSDTSSRRASGRSCSRCYSRRHCCHGRWHCHPVTGPKDPLVGREVEVGGSDTEDLGPN